MVYMIKDGEIFLVKVLLLIVFDVYVVIEFFVLLVIVLVGGKVVFRVSVIL